MQNAAFAARGLDWAYVALDVPPERLEEAVHGLAALGFAGANITAPHKVEVARIVGSSLPSVNTLVGARRPFDRHRDPRGLRPSGRVLIGDGGAAAAFRTRCRTRASSRGAANGRPMPRTPTSS